MRCQTGSRALKAEEVQVSASKEGRSFSTAGGETAGPLSVQGFFT